MWLVDMSGNLDLVELPEWSEFFRSLIVNGRVRMHWRERQGGWTSQAYQYSSDLTKPICEVPLGPEIKGQDRFDVLHDALKACSLEVKEPVWTAFYAFRSAATGESTNIEDLL